MDVLVVRLHLIVWFSTRKADKEFMALGAFLMAVHTIIIMISIII